MEAILLTMLMTCTILSSYKPSIIEPLPTTCVATPHTLPAGDANFKIEV